MISICHRWAGLIVLLLQIWVARADYQCVCSYSVETPVQPSPSESGPPLGYMYEFDCKPVYGDNHSPTNGYQAVQMENKVGYVKMGDDTHMIQLCQGSVPDEDKVTVPPSSAPSIATNQIKSSPTSQISAVPLTSVISSTSNGTHSAPTSSTNGMHSQKSTSTSGSTYSSPASSKSPLTTISSSVQTISGSTISPNITITSAINTTPTTHASFTNVSTQSFAATTVVSTSSIASTTSSSTAGITTATTKVSAHSPSNTTVKTITTSTSSANATPTNSTQATPTTTRPVTSTVTTTTTSTTRPTTTTTRPTTTTRLTTTTRPTTTTRLTTTTTTTTTRRPTTTRPTTTTAKTTTTTTKPTPTTAHHLVPKCKAGWTLHQGSCYLFHTSSRTNWKTANSICASYRAHLVFIETQDEYQFVWNELRQFIDSQTSILSDDIDDDSDGGVWTGATDHDTEGKWVWHDGNTGRDTQMGHFQHWQKGEPDAGDGDHDEDCMCMIREHDLKWNDYRCSENMFYVCEMAPIMTSHAVASSSCEDGWAAYQTSCYYVHASHRAHWSTAAASCLSEGAHLAIIETQNENTFLKTLLGHHVNKDGNDEDAGVWVGGTDHDKEGQWVWHNDVTGVNTKIGPFTNWHHGEPDSGEHDHDEDCMCMIGDKGFDWQDYSCGRSMFYVCEKSMPRLTQPGTNKYHLSCPGGWTLHGESCYQFSHSDHREWDEAADKCRESIAHLVIIETSEEQSFLYSQLRHIMGSSSDEGFWTGGSDDHHEGTWVWANTLTRHETALNGFSFWRQGYPQTGMDCLAMFGNHGYRWEDHRCRNDLYHICEKSA